MTDNPKETAALWLRKNGGRAGAAAAILAAGIALIAGYPEMADQIWNLVLESSKEMQP